MAAPISQSSQGVRRESNYCYSIGRTTIVLRALSAWIRQRTAPTIIGTCSFPGCKRARSTASGRLGRMSRIGVSGSIPPRYYSIRMAGRLVFPRITAARRRSLEGKNAATAMKSVLADPRAYDWEGDVPLNLPWARTIIYEMHVRGFTADPSSGVAESKRGTYAGLIEKIPYLQELGITAVELLPVFQFDTQDAPQGRSNYWGYSPVSFFAPHQGYSSNQEPLAAVDEFRDMVKALHCAGIEVILDVVFNHTAEGEHDGPTQCFRGLDNPTYYLLAEEPSRYANFTGTGNTLNANHPVVRRMIVDSLRYWVTEMHVDGFRFDLASILARDSPAP